MNIIVLICGKAGAGKDTAADALVALGFRKVAFADALRRQLCALDPIVSCPGSTCEVKPIRFSEAIVELGYHKAKQVFPEMRRLMQAYGTEVVRRSFGEDAWAHAALHSIEDIWSEPGPNVPIVISDLRFRNELECAQRFYAHCTRVYLWKVVRKEIFDMVHVSESVPFSDAECSVFRNEGALDSFTKTINYYGMDLLDLVRGSGS